MALSHTPSHSLQRQNVLYLYNEHTEDYVRPSSPVSVVFSGPMEALALDKPFSLGKTTGCRINTLVATDHPDGSQAAGR